MCLRKPCVSEVCLAEYRFPLFTLDSFAPTDCREVPVSRVQTLYTNPSGVKGLASNFHLDHSSAGSLLGKKGWKVLSLVLSMFYQPSFS